MTTAPTGTIRYPDRSSPGLMAKRAWWLVGLTIILPGSAQILAGSRWLGRIVLLATLAFWALAITAIALYFSARDLLLVVATNVEALTVIQVLLLSYAVLWVVLAIDTLRLVRLVNLRAGARLGVVGALVLAMVAAAGAVGYGANLVGVSRSVIVEVFRAAEEVEPPIDGRYNILLLGGDAGPDRLGLRPDSISVVSIDAATGAATIIGVPRNLEQVPFADGSPLWGEFPNGYDCGDECLVSYLYTYGVEHPDLYPDAESDGSDPGIEAMRDAVSAVTGLELQYYVLIDMQGFSDLIDALGGVEITVEEPVLLGKNGSAPIGEIAAGTQRMDGYTALWYARSRYQTDDYARMTRQREVQEAILVQFEPANVLSKFQAVATAGAQVVKTDIPRSMLSTFVSLASKTRAQSVAKVELTPDNGVSTAFPDYDAIHAMIDAALVAPAATPTPTR